MVSCLSHLAQLAGAHAINGVLEGVVIALFANAFLWAISCRNSRTRFAVLFSTLLTIAGLSFVALAPSAGVDATAAHFTIPIAWAEYALIAWGVIASAGLLRIVMGLAQVRRIRRNCELAPHSIFNPELRRMLDEFRSVRRVNLYISEALRVPAAMGFFRPAVVLPRWVVDELSPAELNAVVLHELGHLRRWDDWTNLAQRIVRAVLFFHPAVWWLDSRLTLEREMACDDLVLAQGGDARRYAECLVAVAEKSAINSRLALALAAVTRVKQTALRLTRILDPGRRVETRTSRFAVSTIGIVSVSAFAILPHTPALITFQSSGDTVQHAHLQSAFPAGTERGTLIPASYNNAGASVKLVPAMLHYSVSANTENRKLKARKAHSAQVKRAIPAQGRSMSPIVTRASFQDENISTVPALLVVVQTDDNNFACIWSVCVWRVTSVPNSQAEQPAQIQNGTVRKSI